VVGKEYFVLPETLHSDLPKVLSTADPLKKMSASLGPKHHINVFSAPDVIRKQIKSAVTDSGDTPAGQLSPGVENLFAMINAAGGHPDSAQLKEDLLKGELLYGRLKEMAGNVMVELTEPFREKRIEIETHQKSYKEQIADSAEVIRKQAQKTIYEVKDLIGLTNVRR
jgi:tryptophanyl-tRNA synthetase